MIKNKKSYYKADNFELYLGDCLKLLKRISDESIDMCFADPPYFLSNGGITVQSGQMVSVNKAGWDVSQGVKANSTFYHKWIREVKRILKPHGTLWISGTYHSIYLCGYFLALEDYKLLNDVAWFKPNASPNISCRYFTASHETLLWAAKNKKSKHTFNYDLMKNGHWHTEDPLKKSEKQMRSIWSVPTPPPREKLHGRHPTQKPLRLLERIILASTNKGDTILDPFTGSSTTGIAAIKHGRNFIGIDTEREFLDLSIARHQALDVI